LGYFIRFLSKSNRYRGVIMALSLLWRYRYCRVIVIVAPKLTKVKKG